jgi:hypothetical protein
LYSSWFNQRYTQAQFTTTVAVPAQVYTDVSTNGTAAGAATIPFNTDIKGLINTTTDNDFYKFVITTGGTATITLTTLPADFDIRLYSSNGTTNWVFLKMQAPPAKPSPYLYCRNHCVQSVWFFWSE